MALTITIPGAVEATIGATAPAVLTIGVGTPGATGPAGPGVPAGGTAGQFLTKINSTNYNTDWTTVNLSQYAVKANNLSDLASAPDARTNLGLGTMATATAANYSTTAAANLLYAPIAAGQPISGTVGQVLTKNSGTNYDSSWATLIPGDRYLTSSTTSLTIDNANKTLTVGTGLSYTSQQDVIIAYDATHHMHALVLTYDSGTGVMTVDVQSHTGTGTFTAWTVNVGGTVPVASIVWGDITGTLGDQTDLATALNSKLELSGGVLDANSTIQVSTATQLAVFGGSGLNVELSANPSENSGLQYNGLQVQNFSGTMAVTASGLTFPDSTTQSTAGLSPATAASTYYLQTNPSGFITSASLSGYAQLAGATFTGEVSTPASTTSSAGLSILPGTAPTSPVNGEIWNTGSDLQVRLSGVTETIAEQSWVSTNYAPKADAALTGNVTITTNSATAALTITQDGAGDILRLNDVAGDTTFTFVDALGKVNTVAATTASAGLNVAHGVAPTSPVNGDIWTTTGGVFARINAGTTQLMNLGSTQTVSGSITFSNANLVLGSSTAAGTIAIGNGATVSGSTKNVNIATNGVSGSTTTMTLGPSASASTIDIGPSVLTSTFGLGTGNNLTGATKTVNIGTNGTTGTTAINIGSTSGTTITVNGATTFTGATQTLGNSTGASTINVGTGATLTATTKAVNIGTGGVAGSTTNIAIGTTSGGTNAITVNGPTTFTSSITAANNSITLGSGTATSVFNFANGATLSGSTKAVELGTQGAAGSTTTIAIGGTAGTSTTTLNGTTNGVTQTAGDSSLKLATTAFVTTADNLKANLASPTFTGTPTLPTGTIGVTQSPGNNTTALATTAFVTAAVPAFATETQAIVGTSSTTTISPLTMRHILSNAGYTAHTSLVGNYSSYVSGSASVSTLWSNLVGLSVTAANGKVAFLPNSQVSYFPFTSRGKAELNLDWTKPVWFSFRFNYSSSGSIGDSNTVNRVTIGKFSSVFGDLTNKGFGVTWTAGTTGAFTVSAHNGTTLTSSASAVTVSNTTYFPTTSAAADFLVYSDGTGNITLFCNGVQVATTTGGPSSGNLVGGRFTFEADNTTSTSGTVALDYTGIRSMYSY
jgi:hypothetical protein